MKEETIMRRSLTLVAALVVFSLLLCSCGTVNGYKKKDLVPVNEKPGMDAVQVFVFSLKNEAGKVPLSFDAGNNSIDKIYEGLNTDANGNKGNVLAYGRLDGNYTYK